MRLALTDYLLKHYAAEQKAVVLIVDEAQHLDAALLEELRMLANLEAPGGRAVQVLLVGQPSLLETLRRPELASLRQRIGARTELGPMSLEEAADYLLHHLRSAGVRPEDLFADEAVELLARGTQGVPRLLNQSAHKALALAAGAEADIVDAEAALEALAALGLEAETSAETAAVPESEEIYPRINGQVHAELQG
jgi:type II secretory pathway predicted ATPase ExeA